MAAAIGNSSAFAQDNASNGASSESEIEEVIVLGIRASLESALAAKRERANLTEIINADDFICIYSFSFSSYIILRYSPKI